jgi:diguanylate cyclase (GGDEF)-like protein
MEFDPRMTLGVAISSLLMAVVFHFQARSFPSNINGIQRWRWAFGLFGIAMLLLATRGVLPDFFSLFLGALLIQAGILVFYSGLCQFQGRTQHLAWVAAPMAVNTFSMLWFLYGEPLLWARVFVNSFCSMLMLLSCLVLVLTGRAGEPKWRFSKLHTGFFLGCLVLITLVRGTFAVVYQPIIQPQVSSQLYLVFSVVFPSLVMAISTGLILMAFDRLKDELEYLVSHDVLTGAYSRRGFLSLAESEISRALRMQRHTALLVLDLDHFKQVNDRYGHPAGDLVLRKFTEITKTCLRREDLMGRFGGEEFMVLLPDTAPDAARVVAERIRTAVHATRLASTQHHIRFTVSIGIANAAGRGTLEEMLKLADTAMYLAKSRGRNRVEVA